MSDYFGDIRLGDTIDIKFTTRQISGAPSTLGGSPVISAYPANSTTQLTAGITLTVDFDAVTGYNNVRVVATSGNGYLTATNYDLCITTGTVNNVSVVGESIGSFSIENRSALMPVTAGRTAVVDAAGLIDANMVKAGPSGTGTAITARDIGASVLLSNGTGTGQLKLASGYVAMTWADVAAPTTAVNLSATTINLANTVTTYTGNTVQTGDVATLITTVGAAGAGLTAVGLATTSRAGIRKNTALTNFEIVMTDSTNHNPATGKTVSVTRSIDHAAFGAGTLSAVTELANGVYYFDWGAGDLNGSIIMLRATAAGCDDLLLLIATNP